MKGVKKSKLVFSENADEHIRVKFKKRTNDLPDKDTVKQYLDNGEFTLSHCPTQEMIADILTKPLQGSQFIKLRNRLLGYEEAFPNLV